MLFLNILKNNIEGNKRILAPLIYKKKVVWSFDRISVKWSHQRTSYTIWIELFLNTFFSKGKIYWKIVFNCHRGWFGFQLLSFAMWFHLRTYRKDTATAKSKNQPSARYSFGILPQTFTKQWLCLLLLLFLYTDVVIPSVSAGL